MNDVVVVPSPTSSALVGYTAAEVKAHVQRVQQVMRAVMKSGVHYGKIPGAGEKNSLFKPGAEVLCMTFHIAPTYRIDDLSDRDSIRYRVTCIGTHQATGVLLSEGLGEASSNEEKYRWRNAVCEEEFDEASEDRKRAKWQRGKSGVYRRKQVRTEPADIANTVLKMACKRAQVAMTINATAAGDIFTQDLEDMPPEVRESMAGGEDAAAPPAGKPATRPPQARPAASGNGGSGRATEKQVGLVRSKLDAAGVSENQFLDVFKLNDMAELPFSKVDEALGWIRQMMP